MFAFDRSACAVVLPLALLVAAVLWSSNRDRPGAPRQELALSASQDARENQMIRASADARGNQTVAVNLPSR